MNISRAKLEQIILEEVLAVLSEKKPKQSGPGSPWHDPDTGHFTDSKSAGSWSMDGKQLQWPSKSNAAECGRNSRYRCHDRELKYEDALAAPGAPSRETDRERRSDLFPAYNELKQLSQGILEEAFEELLSENEGDKLCFTRPQLEQYKQKLVGSFLRGIEAYEKASNPKK
jgi:hypothetical protein